MTPETATPQSPPPRVETPRAARPARFLAGLLALFAVFVVALLAPGRMVVSNMEGDVFHLLDGVTRMRLGQAPHLDFRTPLGILAYLPVAAWEGLGLGRSLALSHAIAAAVCLPGLAWIGLSRLRAGPALGYAAVVLITATTLSWDPLAKGATAAMSYNRWGWALLMVGGAILLLDRVAPSRRNGAGAVIDGLLIGTLGAILLFLKVTFVVGLAGLWLVWVLTGAERRAVLVSVLAGLGLALALGLATGGVEAFSAYVDDLLAVADAGEIRPMSAARPTVAVITPEGLLLLSCALIGGLALARGGRGREALRFAAACLAAFLLAWQNFGHDPTSMSALAVALLALSGRLAPGALAFGRPAASVAFCAALVMLSVRAEGLVNSARSFAHLYAAPSEQFPAMQAFAPDIYWQRAGKDAAGRVKLYAADDSPITLGEVTQPYCAVLTGMSEMLAEAADAIRADDALRGRSVLTLDLLNPLWMIAGAPPQRGAWNWAYGGAAAQIAEADLVALPRCPFAEPLVKIMVGEVETSGRALRIAARTPNWTFFELGAPGSAPVPDEPAAEEEEKEKEKDGAADE
ncbi:MAG: hypothetical protein VYD87_21745 [Pseudomonadota bacterium]|nr:hypothetical protein [Pseudomonadota bacterium]